MNGQKVWISRIQHSDFMILLARTTPVEQVKKKSEGLSIFLVDLREAIGHGLRGEADSEHGQSRNERTVLRQPRIPAQNLMAKKEKASVTFSMAQRRALIDRRQMHRRLLLVYRQVVRYTKERVVFGRPIGQTKAFSFPLPKFISTRKQRI